MITNEKYEYLAYPGVYPDENEIIPYSPRRKFGFASHMSDMSYDKTEDKSKIIKLESMRHMSIDQIVQLYKYGYKIEDISPTIETTQGGVYISTGALWLGVGIIVLIYYLKKIDNSKMLSKGKM